MNGRAGSYRFQGPPIARGGFGMIFRGEHAETGLPAAIKIIHADLFADPTSIQRFEREAAILFELSHPNAVRIHEIGHIDDGRPYIAMELLSGVGLEARLAEAERLSVEEALSILEPLAEILGVAHARGIVHRDIKPSNIFLADGRPEGRVVLLDFGIAKFLDAAGPSLTASRATLGTLPYMAPEQMLAQSVDQRADVYALAALAFAMLTGKPPFGARATHVVRQIHLHARPPRPSELAPIDPALDEPLLRALERDPANRPASAAALVSALRAASAAKSRAPNALPEGVSLRPSLAVYAELRPDPTAMVDADESLLAAIEAWLPIVSAELAAAGLVAWKETSTSLLCISPDPPNPTLGRRVLDACVRAHRRAMEGPLSRQPVELGLVAFEGALHASEEGALLPGGLLDVASWSPGPVRGVVAAAAVLAGHDEPRAPLPGDERFVQIER